MHNQSIAHAIDIHHATRRKMQNGFTQLRRTIGVHAAVVHLPFGANHVPAANRTPLRHMKFSVAARMILIVDYARDFGNHVPSALDLDPVADLHAQAINLVHVVERGAADRGSTDGNRLQGRDRREFSGASHLHQNVFDLGDSRTRGIFVGNRPARSLAGAY